MRFPRLGMLSLALLASFGCRDLVVPQAQVGSVTGELRSRTAPVADAVVLLTGETGVTVETTTGADGHFSSSGLSPGLWSLSITVSGYLPIERSFSINAGATRELRVLTLYSEAVDVETAGTITGTARVDGAETGSIQGATVEALRQPDSIVVATTSLGASGLFALQLPPATYRLRVTHPFFVTALSKATEVASKASVQLADDELVLPLNPGRVTGVVLKEVDGSPTRVPAVNVTITADNGSAATTAMDGTFDLGGLPGGERRLRLSATALHEETPNLLVSVIPGQASALSELGMLLDRGEVVGAVEMGDASALRDVTVSLDGTSYSSGAVPLPSDASKGSFRIGGVPVGTYSLTATRAGYRSVTSGAFTIEANKAVVAPALGRFTRVQGDFSVDDGDATNTPGFTRTRAVTLVVNDPSGVAGWRAAETDPTALPFQPFGADGGTGIAFQLSATEGERTIFLQLRDALGNPGPVLAASIVLDLTAPANAALRLADGTTHTSLTNPLPFSLTGADGAAPGVTASGLAFMRLSLSPTVDGAGNLSGARLTYLRDDSFTRPSAVDGPVTLYAQLIDNAGNVGAPTSASIVVDTLAPSSSLTIQQGDAATQPGFTNTPLATLLLSTAAEPNGGSVRVRLANNVTDVDVATPVAASSAIAWFLDPLADGVKTVSYRLVDSAGNQSSVQSATITLDRAAPVPLSPSLVLATLGSAQITNSRSGSLTITASDARQLSPTAATLLEVSGVASSLPPTSSTTVTGVLPFTLPDADGSHLVRVRFRDAAGNISAATEFSLALDRVAPAGTLALQGALADGTASSSVSASQLARVLVSQFGATRVLLTTGALASCPAVSGAWLSLGDPALSSFNLGVGNGLATVRACLADDAGNTTLLNAALMTVDTSVPTGCALQLSGTKRDTTTAPAGFSASASVAASLSSCAETPAEVYVTESAVTCSASASLPWIPLGALTSFALSPADGTRVVRGCVRDAARNVGSLVQASMTLDTTPPAGATVLINADAAFVNASQVTAGTHSASLSGSASGATEWAVGTATGATNFLTFSGSGTRSLALPISADGTLTVYARYRDAVGNESYAVDVIEADITAPAAPTVAVQPTGDPGFVKTEVTTVSLSGLTGVTGVRLSEGLDLAACTAALASAALQPPLSVYTLVLSPTEGTHVVCASSLDAAGNPSVRASTSVTLDKTAPTRPVIVTPDGFAPLADGATTIVDIAAASSDGFFKGYQRLGGDVAVWTDVAPSGLRFLLPVANDGSEAGFRNELRLRATDRAGNASAESSVLITADTNLPEAAVVDLRWVDNTNRQATLYWQAPATSPDVDHYDVFYDGAPVTPLGGTYAAEGPSPLRIAATSATPSASLSGLQNESTTWVQVVPVDKAGNRGPANATLLALQPNLISPNVVASIDLPGVTHAWAMEHRDGYLYVAASLHAPTTCGINGDVKILTYDVRRLVSPVQGGVINAAPPPTLTSTLSFPGTFVCTASNTVPQMDIGIDPPWLFVSSNASVRVFDISVPASPVLKTTLALPVNTRGTQLELVGDTLMVVGTNPAVTMAINLAKLYDNDATTSPSTATDTIGSLAAGPFLPETFLTTRDVMLTYEGNSAVTGIRLADALDHNAGTTWDLAGDAFAQNQFYLFQPINFPVVSGNYSYHSTGNSGLAVYPLNTIWASTLPAVSAIKFIPGYSGSTRIDVKGDEVYLTDSNTRGVRVADLRDLTAVQAVTGYDLQRTDAKQTLVFGNYEAVLSSSTQTNGAPNLTLLEISTPRSFSTRASLDSTGYGRPEVRPGFVMTGGFPSIFDLHSGETPVVVSGGFANTCMGGYASFDDTQVQAFDTRLRVLNLETMLDRDPTNNPVVSGECLGPTTSNDYCVTHPTAGVQMFDVAAWGNYLVVAELRATRQELWVEIFDARPLKDRSTATPLSLTSPVASLKVFTAAAGSGSRLATLDMTQGIATLTLQDDPFSLLVGGRVFAVDLRAAFDDNVATVLSASSVQADFAMPNTSLGGVVQPRAAKLSGNTLYVASNRGTWAFPAAEVTDGVVGTVTTGAGAQSALINHAFDDLEVYGSTVITAPGDANGQLQAIVAFDTSTSPTTLRPTGYAVFPAPSTAGNTCVSPGPPASTLRKVRGGIAVSGSKAYVRHPSSFGKLRIINLE